MNDIIQILLKLSEDIKQLKADIRKLDASAISDFKDKWIDGQDVLFALNISKRTLQKLRDTGKLPFSRINGKFYYKLSDIEKLLQSNYSANLKINDHGNYQK
jgi:hypothetical protein